MFSEGCVDECREVKGSPTLCLLIVDVSMGTGTYHFLRDPPPGFLPRLGLITVSGLAGPILARKGRFFSKTRWVTARRVSERLYSNH